MSRIMEAAVQNHRQDRSQEASFEYEFVLPSDAPRKLAQLTTERILILVAVGEPTLSVSRLVRGTNQRVACPSLMLAQNIATQMATASVFLSSCV